MKSFHASYMLQVSYGHEQLNISRPGEIHWSCYRSPSQNFQSFHFVWSDMDTFQRNFLFLFPHPPEGQLPPVWSAWWYCNLSSLVEPLFKCLVSQPPHYQSSAWQDLIPTVSFMHITEMFVFSVEISYWEKQASFIGFVMRCGLWNFVSGIIWHCSRSLGICLRMFVKDWCLISVQTMVQQQLPSPYSQLSSHHHCLYVYNYTTIILKWAVSLLIRQVAIIEMSFCFKSL